jgi:hypothetical protein
VGVSFFNARTTGASGGGTSGKIRGNIMVYTLVLPPPEGTWLPPPAHKRLPATITKKTAIMILLIIILPPKIIKMIHLSIKRIKT